MLSVRTSAGLALCRPRNGGAACWVVRPPPPAGRPARGARCGGLAEQRCEPCEASAEALEAMRLSQVMTEDEALELKQQLHPAWVVVRDAEQRLRIRRVMRTKNFVKALELFRRIGEVAEAEGHHPDLHLESWNTATVELWTHARGGLSDNDFVLAAKVDQLALDDLLSKKQPPLPES